MEYVGAEPDGQDDFVESEIKSLKIKNNFKLFFTKSYICIFFMLNKMIILLYKIKLWQKD